MEAKCPFSGEIIRSNESFIFSNNSEAYRFQSCFNNEVFFLITHTNYGFKVAFYFPSQGVFFYKFNQIVPGFIGTNPQKFLHDSLFETIRDWKQVSKYIKNNNSKLPSILFCSGHIEHYIWNNLSALERFQKHGVFEKIAKFYSFGYLNTFAPIEYLFPELQKNYYKINLSDLRKIICEENSFF